MKKYFIIFLILLSIFLLIKKKNDIILYYWDIDYINQGDYDNLYKIIDKLNINILYQDFSSEYLHNADRKLSD